MNILMLSKYPSFSDKAWGGEISTDVLAANLVKLGHQVTIVNVEATRSVDGIEYVKGEYQWLRGYPFYVKTDWLFSNLIMFQYDIVHHIGTEGYAWEKMCKKNKVYREIPSVCSLLSPRARPLGVDKRWKILLKGKPFRWYASYLEGYCAQNASWVTAASYASRAALMKEHNLTQEKFQAIHHGIDIEGWSGRPSEYVWSNPARFQFITVCRLDKAKGVHRVIEAMPQVIHHLAARDLHQDPHQNVHLTIIGDGKERKNLERLIVEKGMELNVHMIGRIPAHRVKSWYNGADALLQLSDFEPFGRIVLEAACQKCPSIVSRTGGLRELVRHKTHGLTVDHTDTNAIADAMLLLVKNPVMGKHLGEQAYLNVTEKHTLKREAEEYEKLYKKLIGSDRDL